MATYHGKAGSAKFNSLALEMVTDWSIDITGDVAEGTAMSDAVKTYLAGFVDWTATVTCRLDTTAGVLDTHFDGSIQTLDIEATGSTETFSGSAIMTGINPSADKDDVAMVTYTFQGSGALTLETVPVV